MNIIYKHFISLASIPLLVLGCVTLPPQYANAPTNYSLDPAAADVKIIEFLPTEEREKYNEVQMVSCVLGFNAEQAETNIEYCNNHFKNEAHALGSNLVIVKPETKRVGVDTYANAKGNASPCHNCVDIKGIVLMPKAAAPAPAPVKSKKRGK